MPPDTLDEREFELINIIGAELVSNQRDLSRHMDLSLGLVNMLLRRLIAKGYIRINQLNKRKVEYLLTPEGFAEKMRKSVKYTLKTINSIGLIKERLKDLLSEVVQKGERDFLILGESDFALLVEIVLRDLCQDEYKIKNIEMLPKDKAARFILICREGVSGNGFSHCLNLVEELAKFYVNPRTEQELKV